MGRRNKHLQQPNLGRGNTSSEGSEFQPRLPGPAVAVFCLLWASFCLFVYFQNRGPLINLDAWLDALPPLGLFYSRAILRDLIPLSWFLGFVLGSTILGRAALGKWLTNFPLNILEEWVFSFGVGVGIWGLVTLGLAWTGLIQFWIFHGVFVAGVVWAVWSRDRAVSSQVSLKNIWQLESIPFILLVVGALFLIGVHCLTPEIFYDSLVYHLALPSLYKMEGRLVPTVTNLYSGIPMHMEMLYLWGLMGGGQITAKFIHWSMSLGSSLAILGFFLRRHAAWAGWLACSILICMPMMGMNMWKTAVDGGSVFFILLAALALFLRIETVGKITPPDALLWMSAFFVGIAMGIKYTNWPILAVFLVAMRLVGRFSWRKVSLFGLVSVACVAPWLVKNALFYKNPIFPFFNEIWNPLSPTPVNWRGLQIDAWGRNWGPLLSDTGRFFRDAVAQPWVQTMKGMTDADFLGVLPLIFLPILFLFKPSSTGSRLWFYFFVGVWVCWFLTTTMPRMFLPGLGLLIIIYGIFLMDLAYPWMRFLIGSVVLLVSLNNLFFVAATGRQMDCGQILAGTVTPNEYLKVSHSTYPTPDFASRDWINKNTGSSARVLVVGDARGYYLDRPFRASSVFDTDLFWHFANESASAEDLYRRLREAGFSHLLVNLGEIYRLRHPCPAKNLAARENAELFINTRTKLCFEDRNTEPHDFRWSQVLELVPSTVSGNSSVQLIEIYKWMEKKP